MARPETQATFCFHSFTLAHTWVMCTSSVAVLFLFFAHQPLGASTGDRVVPPVDSQLLTREQEIEIEAAYKKRAEEGEVFRREAERIEEQIATAKRNGQETARLESELKDRLAKLDAASSWPSWEPTGVALPAFKSKLSELKQLVTDVKPIDMNGVQQLIDNLYVNIEPRLNRRLQDAVLDYVEFCSNSTPISDEVRSYLRQSVLEYWHAAKDLCDDRKMGAMCSPYSMEAVARALSAVTTSDDAEARELFDELKRRAFAKCDELQRIDWKEQLTRRFARSEDRLLLSAEEILNVRVLDSGTPADLDFERLLRAYRKVLNGTPRRVPKATVEIIDRNLVVVAAYELNRTEWDLWADACIALGVKRASAPLKDLVARTSGKDQKAKDKAMAKVNRSFQRP